MEKRYSLLTSNAHWITQLIKPYWKNILLAIALVIVRSTILLAPPLIIKELVDSVLPQRDEFRLIFYTIGIAMIPVINGGLIIMELKVSKYILKLGANLRADIFNGLQHQPLQWLTSTKTGDLMQRALDETKEVTIFAYQGFSTTVWYLMTTLVGLVMMFFLDWKLSIIVIIILLLQTYVIQKLGNYATNQSKLVSKVNSNVLEQFRETVAGALFIKTNSTEEYETNRLSDRLDEHYHGYKRFILLDGAVDFLQVLFVSCVNGVLYLWGGLRVLEGGLTIGSLIALAGIYTWVQPMLASYFIMYIYGKRMTPLLNRIREIIYPVKNETSEIIPRVPIDISVRNVHFYYDDMKKVLNGVNFELPAGKKMAILGPSGSGKSTISDIILRLIKPNSGEILLGGVPLGDINERWFRSKVRYVTQDVQLRTGTLLDNILYPDSTASPQEVDEALKMAGLYDWVQKQPLGINTEIGEDGMKLSGGERQRVSITRAILSHPLVLILDEATSALDNITELDVIQNIYKALPKTTVIFITHRLSVLKYSEVVFRLENGRLIEEKSKN